MAETDLLSQPIAVPSSEQIEASGRRAMEIDEGEPTPTKRLPSIQNLFGIAREEPLAAVRRTPTMSIPESPEQETLAPNSPARSQSSALSRSPATEHSARNLAGGMPSSSTPSSSLGPIRTRHSSNASPYGRSANVVPNTPPRQVRGVAALTFSPDDTGLRRSGSLSRHSQGLKAMLSPTAKRLPLDYEGYNDPSASRRSGHRPASSSSGSLSTMFSHISTNSDTAPMLPPGYPSSTQTSAESVTHEGWGAGSAHSGSTSPRTSWHSRSSTLESGESAYKMMGADRGPPSLLPPFRESAHQGGEGPMMHSAGPSSLSRHRSLRTPGAAANLPIGEQRPRARTLTHADRPIAPLPNSEDPSRRQKLEAAGELLRMGQQAPEGYYPTLGGRQNTHKHSASMQERAPQPAEFYENSNVVRAHRPKSHSLSVRDPGELGRPMPPAGMYYSHSSGGAPYDRNMPSSMSSESLHLRRPNDDGMRPPPAGSGWIFPRRPTPTDPAEVQRNYQAQLMHEHGLASVPDGMMSAHIGGSSRNTGTTGTIASGQAKYECAWCGKRFSRPSSLKIHHHSHTGEKPFVCNEPGCGRSFSVQSNLRRHQKCHTPGGESESGPGRSDEAMWSRGPPPPAPSSGSRMSPGSSGWQPHYGRSHGHSHSRSLGQMPSKDHPPLSRSAYEPGSRSSMTTWSERQDTGENQRWQATNSPRRRFGQMRDQGLSSSSNEEDELEYEEAESSARAGPRVKASSSSSSQSGGGDEEDYDKTITSPSAAQDRPQSGTSSSSSGLRVGFGSLLNPTAKEQA